MTNLFTAREADAAHALIDRARWYAREYAQPDDLDAAIKAVLTVALELTHSRHQSASSEIKAIAEND